MVSTKEKELFVDLQGKREPDIPQYLLTIYLQTEYLIQPSLHFYPSLQALILDSAALTSSRPTYTDLDLSDPHSRRLACTTLSALSDHSSS